MINFLIIHFHGRSLYMEQKGHRESGNSICVLALVLSDVHDILFIPYNNLER